MKKFINKKTGHSGTLVLDTPVEVQIRIPHNPVLWSGTREDFESQWVALDDGTKNPTPPPAPPEKDWPYNYFVSFLAGTKAGNISIGLPRPVVSATDLVFLEEQIRSKTGVNESVVIINFRLYDDADNVIDWASRAYPAIQRVLNEIRGVPLWAGYFEPQNRQVLEKLVNYVPVQEEIQAGLVEIQRPAGSSVTAETNKA